MNLFSKREAPCLRITRSLCVISTMAFIAGCGGGGGGDSADNPPQSATANATLSFNPVTVTSGFVTTTYEATRVMVDLGARAHLADVGPFPDLPGQGTTIMVIDDFTAIHASTTTFPRINRAISAHSSTERYSATYSVPYQLDTSYTHGALVSRIAGGYSGASALTFTVPSSNTTDLVSCTLSFQATQLVCPKAFHTNAPASTLTATVSMSPIPGVAAEATMLRSPVDLSSSQDAVDTTASIYGHLRNSLLSSTVNVVNLSLGADMGLSNDILKDLQTLKDTFPIAKDATAVITIAAGNSSTPCSANYFGCNTMAMAMALQDTTKNSTVVVGALTGTDFAEKIADYSTRPGDLASRFIYASGDTGFYGGARGTSFAAPRVAGVAAIIKQKYPKLTSDQIANIILDSADRDINNDGKPDFVITPPAISDPIYGRGKLSLKNALALAATY